MCLLCLCDRKEPAREDELVSWAALQGFPEGLGEESCWIVGQVISIM